MSPFRKRLCMQNGALTDAHQTSKHPQGRIHELEDQLQQPQKGTTAASGSRQIAGRSAPTELRLSADLEAVLQTASSNAQAARDESQALAREISTLRAEIEVQTTALGGRMASRTLRSTPHPFTTGARDGGAGTAVAAAGRDDKAVEDICERDTTAGGPDRRQPQGESCWLGLGSPALNKNQPLHLRRAVANIHHKPHPSNASCICNLVFFFAHLSPSPCPARVDAAGHSQEQAGSAAGVAHVGLPIQTFLANACT